MSPAYAAQPRARTLRDMSLEPGKGAWGGLSLRVAPPQDSSGLRASVHAPVNDELAVHDDMLDTFTELVWILKRRAVHHPFGVEHDEVGEATRTDEPPIEASKPLCRQ